MIEIKFVALEEDDVASKLFSKASSWRFVEYVYSEILNNLSNTR